MDGSGQLQEAGRYGTISCMDFRGTRIVRCDEEGLAAAAKVLCGGGVAVIPTDTVYGLAAHPGSPAAVERLYAIKGREARKPVALLAADADAVARFGFRLSGEAAALARRWPGALTVVVSNGSATEGFRVPDHEWTRRLLAECGGVLRVTSANLSGRRDATDAQAALADVGLSADIVVDGGTSPGGVPSTVARVSADGSVEILRQGAVRI